MADTPREIPVTITIKNADTLRALAQSVHEATQRLAEATALVVEMLAELNAAQPETALCPECKGDGLPPLHREDLTNCETCQGHGVVEVVKPRQGDGTLVEPTRALDPEPLVGAGRPMPRKCPECKAGKSQNCTRYLEDGVTMCVNYQGGQA